MSFLTALALIAAIGPQSGVIARPDVKLPYRVVGHGAPVLMLSGGPGFTVDYMEDIARRVGLDAYGWILPEQRGTPRAKLAKPTAAAFEMKEYVADLEALRVRLGLKQWTVVGQSWGSVLAEGYAVAHPDRVRSLVLLDTPGPDLEWLSFGSDNLARVLTPEDRKAAIAAVQNNPNDPDAQVFESFIANLPAYFYSREAAVKNKDLFKPGCVTGSTLPLVFGNLQREKWNVTKTLRRFTGPALVIQGRQDFLGESAAMKAAQALPNGRLVFIERAGHIAWLDQPGPFIGALSAFLKRTLGSETSSIREPSPTRDAMLLRTLFTIPALLVLTGTACRGQGKEFELKLPMAKVAEALDQVLGGTTLATAPDQKPGTGTKLQFQLGLDGAKQFEFALPDRRIELGYAGAIVYRLNNLKMDTCRCHEQSGDLVMSSELESQGPTLKGTHTVIGSSLIPDVSLKNMRLTIRVTPIIDKAGRPTYDNPRATFKADVSSSLGQLSLAGQDIDLLDEITGYRRTICRGIETEVAKALASPEMKATISAKMWSSLENFAAGYKAHPISCRIEGDQFKVRLALDPIDR